MLLTVEHLRIAFKAEGRVAVPVRDVTFSVPRSGRVAIVGESGCGKSLTALSLGGLVDRAEITGKISGTKRISYVFQNPMQSLNPVMRVEAQIAEALGGKFKNEIVKLLADVGLGEDTLRKYPCQLSGGQQQRVMIAMALAAKSELLVADEPTTALDVTIQAQILDLLRELKDRINGSIMLITHDLGIIAEMADYVVVMYAGRVIERGTVQEIFHNPLHPYTIGLQKSKPTMDSDTDKLFNIPGNVPNPVNMPNYCYFKDRCSKCTEKCNGDFPCMIQVSPTHFVACHLYGEEETNG